MTICAVIDLGARDPAQWHLRDGTRTIVLESPAWAAWLGDEAHAAVRVVCPDVTYTARRERRPASEGWYWYAYRRRAGKLFKRSIGTTAELTAARLLEVGTALSTG